MWNTTTLHGRLDWCVEQFGDRRLVLTEDVVLSYAEVAAQSRRLADGFVALGVRPGDRIGMVMANYPEFVAVKFAIARAGAVAVPFNFLYREDELRYVLADSGCRVLVCMTSFDGLDFQSHPERAGGTATAQHVAHWSNFYDYSREGKHNPVIESAFAWLDEHAPDGESGLGLIWGDARPGNMMFDSEQRVTAVLDWELVGLGPAEIDLGWFTFINRMYTEGIGMDAPPGMPGVEETLVRYCRLAARDLVDFRYYEVLAGTRLAVVMMRLAHMLMAKGFMPPDNPMPMTNPATVVLSDLLGMAQSGSETGWVSGHR